MNALLLAAVTLLTITVGLTLPSVVTSASSSTGAIQAHFGDASYAGGMVFDSQLGVLYVTGQVGPFSCFVGVLKQTMNNDSEGSLSSIQFLSKHVFEESAVCQTMALRRDQTGTPLLLTVMEEGGILTDTRPSGSQKAVQYGGMIELQFNADGSTSHFAPERAVLLHQNTVQIPRSIVADPNVADRVFVAMMTSESSVAQQDGAKAESAIPNWTPSGDFKYGNDYAMTIESLRLASAPGDEDRTFKEARAMWKKPFGVAGDPSGLGAIVNQIVFHGDDELVVVGSTQGSGFAYGEGMDMTMAGFISKFSPDHGQLQLSRRFHVEKESSNMHTYIEAICQDDEDPDSLYIVGSYHGDGDDDKRVPFVAKLATSSLDTMWEQTFLATTSAFALGCGVSQNRGVSSTGNSNGSVVYVAGIVEDGGEIMGQTTSHLKDDVFVFQLSTHDGTALWMTQVGTSGDDRLAHGGSGLVVLDEDDGSRGVLLMGDTTGNLYTTSSHPSEVFVVHVDPQGKTPESSEVSGVDYSKGQAAIVLSTPVRNGEDEDTNGSDTGAADPPSSGSDEGDKPANGGSSDPSNGDSSASDGDVEDSGDKSASSVAAFAGEAIVVFIFLGVFCFACIRQKQKERVTERQLVFGYLQAFDVEDIDVRHSATGGWHGTYVGKLSRGHMDLDSDDDHFEFSDDLDFEANSSGSQEDGDSSSGTGTLLSGYSHSSIVKDSLFVDYDTTPTYGDGSRRRSGKSTYLDDDDEDAGNETSSFVRNPRFYSDQVEETTDRRDGEYSLARLSRKGPGDNQNAMDPWGKEII